MLQTEFSHDTFGMLSFLRLIGLRIDGRMLGFLLNFLHTIYRAKGRIKTLPFKMFQIRKSILN